MYAHNIILIGASAGASKPSKTLWSSLNVIEERGALIGRPAAQAEERDQASVAYQLDGLRKEGAHHSDQIRQMLVNDGDWHSVPDL